MYILLLSCVKLQLQVLVGINFFSLSTYITLEWPLTHHECWDSYHTMDVILVECLKYMNLRPLQIVAPQILTVFMYFTMHVQIASF